MYGIITSFDSATHTGSIESDGETFFFRSSDLPAGLTPQVGLGINFLAKEGAVTAIWGAVQTHPQPFTWNWFLFSLRGRVSRAQFWLRYWLPTRLAFLAFLLIGQQAGLSIKRSAVTDAALISIAAALLWISLAVEVKRWHDRDKSGWWMLVGLIPVIGPFWALAETGLLGGQRGANSYGPDPIAD